MQVTYKPYVIFHSHNLKYSYCKYTNKKRHFQIIQYLYYMPKKIIITESQFKRFIKHQILSENGYGQDEIGEIA